MPLRICVLASGSSGNCVYVGGAHGALLIDAGLSCRETMKRLAAIGAAPARLAAVCLTHEHGDHVDGLGALHRQTGCAVYANGPTVEVLERDARMAGLPWKVFTTGSAFGVGEFSVHPFSVAHDAMDPVGFVIRAGESSAAVVTDIGTATASVRERLRRCQAVVLESNHDEEMLRAADRPWPLKQRIAGRQGHLSNRAAAEVLADVGADGLRAAFLAHISADCNRPDLAVRAVREVLAARGLGAVGVEATYPDRVSRVWDSELGLLG